MGQPCAAMAMRLVTSLDSGDQEDLLDVVVAGRIHCALLHKVRSVCFCGKAHFSPGQISTTHAHDVSRTSQSRACQQIAPMTRLSFACHQFGLGEFQVSWDLYPGLGIPARREMGPEVTTSGTWERPMSLHMST